MTRQGASGGYSPLARIFTLAAYKRACRTLRVKCEPSHVSRAMFESEQGRAIDKQKRHHKGVGASGGYSLRENIHTLRLKSELFDLRVGYTNLRVLRTQCSNLNRARHKEKRMTSTRDVILFYGAPWRIRTFDLPVRSRALYPLS